MASANLYRPPEAERLPDLTVRRTRALNGQAVDMAGFPPWSTWLRSKQARDLYLELTENDGDGSLLAKARGIIWRSAADRVVGRFQAATGVVLGSGIKLLVRAKPEVTPSHGLSLIIDAIDPAFTLGDFEARRREIRARLKHEGVFENHRNFDAPWDYCGVLVVAPEQAAGLGDFKAESDRLEQHGLCSFSYVHARFQGDGAAATIVAALERGLEEWIATWQDRGGKPQAVA